MLAFGVTIFNHDLKSPLCSVTTLVNNHLSIVHISKPGLKLWSNIVEINA